MLLQPEALDLTLRETGGDLTLLGIDEWPHHWRPPPERLEAAARHLSLITGAIQRFAGRPLEAAALRHHLMAYLFGVAEDVTALPSPGSRKDLRLLRNLRRLLDQGVGRRPQVTDLCARLGVSQSTLARACLATEGIGLKPLVDRHLLLEAKRLLVHTDDRIAAIAERLGFDEPTNFIKMFNRLEGVTPSAFRQAHA